MITVKRTDNFDITGDGTSRNWKTTKWVKLNQGNYRENTFETKCKVIYSNTGIYFLFFCQDNKLNATFKENNLHLWKEDVIEIFIWPDKSKEIYFEYELSPLNFDLPLMVLNLDGNLHRWQAWYLEDDRKIIHKTSVKGGKKVSNSEIDSWMGEVFIPFSLLAPICNKPPTSGTKWNANMYRMDYQNKNASFWYWQEVNNNFHDMDKFGVLLFE